MYHLLIGWDFHGAVDDKLLSLQSSVRMYEYKIACDIMHWCRLSRHVIEEITLTSADVSSHIWSHSLKTF